MSKYFIDRPVFAWVIAIVIMLAGGLSILRLPIEQYPSIAPPSIRVSATYPGASAQTVEDTVTQVIEQQMNGLDHLRYISSNSDSSGTAQITLTFKPEPIPTSPRCRCRTSCSSPCRVCRRKCSSRASRFPSRQQHLPDGPGLRLRGRHHDPERHRRLRSQQRAGPDQPCDRRRRPSPCSVPSTPCASGWTRTS